MKSVFLKYNLTKNSQPISGQDKNSAKKTFVYQKLVYLIFKCKSYG